jgi:predicted O-methyltransferase YrrM
VGREIAQVIDVAGAEWLDRPKRADAEAPQQVLEHIRLKPPDVVADVGAGTGYFALRISRVVPQGVVYTVDIQPAMLAIIEQRNRWARHPDRVSWRRRQCPDQIVAQDDRPASGRVAAATPGCPFCIDSLAEVP